jgi:hypothetical protein
VVPKVPLLVPIPASAPSVAIPNDFSRPSYLEMAEKALKCRRLGSTYFIAVCEDMPAGMALRFPRPDDNEDGIVFMVQEAAAQRQIDELHKRVKEKMGQPHALFPLDLLDEKAQAPVGVVDGVTYADGTPLLLCGVAATEDEDGSDKDRERPTQKMARPLVAA